MEIELNLLPEYKKREIAKSQRFRATLWLEAAVLSIVFMLILLLLSYNEILKLNYETVSSDIDAESNKPLYGKMRKYDEEFAKINNRTGDIMTINEDQFYWHKLFYELDSLDLDGITFDGMATSDLSISISGVAEDRDRLIGFKSSLEWSRCFTDVNLPLSNLVKKESIDFLMDFKIKDECLRNK